MKKDSRFAETTYDSRYSKQKRPQKARIESEEESEEPVADSVDVEGEEEEEEEIDMDRVNELLGVEQEEVDAWSDESSEPEVLHTTIVSTQCVAGIRV